MVLFRLFRDSFKLYIFLKLLKQKLPHGWGGEVGSRPLLDNVQKKAAFFLDCFPKVLNVNIYALLKYMCQVKKVL